jgi:hypothetical protein
VLLLYVTVRLCYYVHVFTNGSYLLPVLVHLRHDKKSLTTPDSNLLPTISGLDALVRYTSTPMWIAGPAVGLSTGAPPDGVLVTADNVNVSTM